MCGICGIFDTTGAPVPTDVLLRMNTEMSHRGPDGDGIYSEKEVGLGHRRLSIIDVSGGAQPIGNEDNSIQVVFNGEIYNYLELRQELLARGHQFRTRSDTEVIVHAYEEWGTACVQRFNGMFGFALWDGPKRSLFLARDHLGIKPLYYAIVGSQLIFASEIKALLRHPACPRTADLDAIAELFSFRYVPSPRTMFKGILKLPPGHLLLASQAGTTVSRFWNWKPIHRSTYREPDLVAEYQHLLEDAVRLQLRSDVPLGLFLSSGVDSGALLAIMTAQTSSPVHAYTIGFEGGQLTNEVDDAREMARMYGAVHHSQMLGYEDYISYFQKYMWDLEEPVGNEAVAAFYFVSRLARQDVKVVLMGQGADEPWAGYDRYIGIRYSSTYSSIPVPISNLLSNLITQLPGRFERLKRGAASLGERDMLTRFLKVYSFFTAEMKEQLFTGDLRTLFKQDRFGTRFALQRLQADVAHLDPLSQMLYVDARANLPDDLLMVGDKTSMANSLEARVPFLDVRLVEFVESLSPRLKLRGLTAKYLHKKAMEKWLPREVVYRKKKGFANPVGAWMRDGMRPYVEDCLLGPNSRISSYFDQRNVRTMLEQDRCGRQEHRRHIYLLLSLELWFRTFLPN